MNINTIQIGAVRYPVLHNLTELGYDFNKAFLGFKRARKSHTVENFCKWVKQQDLRFVCTRGQESYKTVYYEI